MNKREDSKQLLAEYIEADSLRNHCFMVARAMEAYATSLGKSGKETDEWWTSGLLHDLDWERYPEEHPKRATRQILPKKGYGRVIIEAIEAHAPDRTGREPKTEMECYLFACDELSGFMYAVSLMRPNKFDDMKVKSVKKKLKDKRFAENVSREDINHGVALIGKSLSDHISFLIDVFRR